MLVHEPCLAELAGPTTSWQGAAWLPAVTTFALRSQLTALAGSACGHCQLCPGSRWKTAKGPGQSCVSNFSEISIIIENYTNFTGSWSAAPGDAPGTSRFISADAEGSGLNTGNHHRRLWWRSCSRGEHFGYHNHKTVLSCPAPCLAFPHTRHLLREPGARALNFFSSPILMRFWRSLGHFPEWKQYHMKKNGIKPVR